MGEDGKSSKCLYKIPGPKNKMEKKDLLEMQSRPVFLRQFLYAPKGGWVKQGRAVVEEKEQFPIKYTSVLGESRQMTVHKLVQYDMLQNSSLGSS